LFYGPRTSKVWETLLWTLAKKILILVILIFKKNLKNLWRDPIKAPHATHYYFYLSDFNRLTFKKKLRGNSKILHLGFDPSFIISYEVVFYNPTNLQAHPFIY
jgi:hypothetical protein